MKCSVIINGCINTGLSVTATIRFHNKAFPGLTCILYLNTNGAFKISKGQFDFKSTLTKSFIAN